MYSVSRIVFLYTLMGYRFAWDCRKYFTINVLVMSACWVYLNICECSDRKRQLCNKSYLRLWCFARTHPDPEHYKSSLDQRWMWKIRHPFSPSNDLAYPKIISAQILGMVIASMGETHHLNVNVTTAQDCNAQFQSFHHHFWWDSLRSGNMQQYHFSNATIW